MQTDASERKLEKRTTIHIEALDAIMHVNSLFTLAVFLGLTWDPSDPSNTLIADRSCIPSKYTAKWLVTFQVFSFSSFLFSSLLALTLKQAIKIYTRHPPPPSTSPAHCSTTPDVNKNMLRVVLLFSAFGSVAGCLFLMLALVNAVQLKLGTLGCGSLHSYGAVVPLLVFVPAGLLMYVGLVSYAFTR